MTRFFAGLLAASIVASIVLAVANIAWEALREGTDARRLLMGLFVHWTGFVPFVLVLGAPGWLLLRFILMRVHRGDIVIVPLLAFAGAGAFNGAASVVLVAWLAEFEPSDAIPGVIAAFAAAGGVGGAAAWWVERRLSRGRNSKGTAYA